jgi:hypothetical protein
MARVIATDARALLVAELEAVPAYGRFAGVDELNSQAARLADQFPATDLRQIGTSRLGEPLWCLTVGAGDRDAVVVALPHPNEPIGGLAAMHLAERLCRDAELVRRLDFRWHVVPCIDPDGTRMNEGWFGEGERLTREQFARCFFREAPDEQVEWTFPLAYKRAHFDRVLPESLALMRLLDATQPAFMASLHNHELGGAYFYATRSTSALNSDLAFVARHLELPLDLHNQDAVGSNAHAPGVFIPGRARDLYDSLERAGVDPRPWIVGASSWEYAERYGTFTLLCEVPYWIDPQAQDDEPSDLALGDVLREQARDLTDLGEVTSGILDSVVRREHHNSSLLRAVNAFAELASGDGSRIESEAAGVRVARKATKAEKFSARSYVHMQRLHVGGMLLRFLDDELARGRAAPVLRQARDTCSKHFEAWLTADAEHLTGARVAEIRRLVAAQYGAILAAAQAV